MFVSIGLMRFKLRIEKKICTKQCDLRCLIVANSIYNFCPSNHNQVFFEVGWFFCVIRCVVLLILKYIFYITLII